VLATRDGHPKIAVKPTVSPPLCIIPAVLVPGTPPMHRILPSLLACVALSLPAFAGTLTWTGAAGSSWSASANWAEGLTPQDGDSLVFPASAIGVTNNDVTGLDLAKISVGLATSSSYTFTGNAITVRGGIGPPIASLGNVLQASWSIPLTIKGNQMFMGCRISSEIHLNGDTLSLSGVAVDGTIIGTGTVSPVNTVVNGSIDRRIGIRHDIGMLDVNGSVGNVSGFGSTAGTGSIQYLMTGPLYPGRAELRPDRHYTFTDPHTIGTLSTAALELKRESSFDIAGDSHDQVVTTGTVTLGYEPLIITSSSRDTLPQRELVLIANDETDAVIGTFRSKPEGSLVLAANATSGAVFRISYKGGDGNDVTLTPAPETKVWTGSVNSQWSTGGNWNDGAAPRNGDSLVFFTSAGIPNRDIVNDIPGLRLKSVQVEPAHPYKDITIRGEQASISGGVSGGRSVAHWLLPVALTGSQTFTPGLLILRGSIDTGNSTLTLKLESSIDVYSSIVGNGRLIVTGTGIVTFRESAHVSVPVTAHSLGADVLVEAPAKISGTMSVQQAETGGTGSLGAVSLRESDLWVGDERIREYVDPGIGTLSTGSLEIQQSTIRIQLSGYAAEEYDRLIVQGTVRLVDTALGVFVFGDFAPKMGQTFVILRNDGTDPIDGQFKDLPEGGLASIFGYTPGYTPGLRISYRGGDGNDVVLTTLPNSITTLSTSRSQTRSGEAFTATALVTGAAAAGGSVTFYNRNAPLGVANVRADGLASITLRLPVGTYLITAEYSGSSTLAPSRSGSVNHLVERGRSNLRLSIPSQTVSSIHVQVSVEPEAPATGGPTGVVTISALDQTMSGTLTGGHFTGTFSRGAANGDVRIQVVYTGDDEFASETLTTEVSLGASISLTDREAVESARDSFVEIPIHLSSPAEKEVRLDYETMDLTATAGSDYLSTTGTLIFEPGVATKTIVVSILADGQVEDPESFRLVLRNAKGAYLERSFATITIKDRPQGSSKRRGVRP
jgi:hypothetical protein